MHLPGSKQATAAGLRQGAEFREQTSVSNVITEMKTITCASLAARFQRVVVLALTVALALVAHGATLWTGPTMDFTQFAPSGSDEIVPGVVLTRDSNEVLYNTAAGETGAGSDSPLDTLWAFGSLSDYASLSYQTLASMRNGDLASLILNQPMVVRLVNEDIYLSVMFTAWGQHGVGGFEYTRSTAPLAVPPTVSITSPASNAVFAAPANVTIVAGASVSGGSVTNVTFLNGATVLGSATASPFSL